MYSLCLEANGSIPSNGAALEKLKNLQNVCPGQSTCVLLDTTVSAFLISQVPALLSA